MNTSSHDTQRPVIALLTDFGLQDGYVGVLKGVILDIAHDAHIVDITHLIAPQQVASGAWVLASSYRYFPAGTVFTCIIDPGVGSTRHPIALHAGNWFFVGPDNGLFDTILREQEVHEVVTLSNPAFHLPQVSTTFHGRDIFAPASAHLAMGVPLRELGTSIDPATLQHLEQDDAVRHDSTITGRVAHIDTYGNLITNIPSSLVPDLFTSAHAELSFADKDMHITQRRRFFSDKPQEQDAQQEPFLYLDSSGHVGVAIQNGNAAQVLNSSYNTPITFVLTA